MRTSSAWVLCAFMAAGCGLQNPDVRVSADVAPMTRPDAGLELDVALDVPADGTIATDEGDSDAGFDAGEDVLSDDVGPDAAEADAVDLDVPDAPEDAAPDAAMDDVVDAATVDAPMDIPDAADAPVDVPVDVPVDAPREVGADVPAVDVGTPIRWNVADGDTHTTPWREGSPPGDSIRTLYCPAGQLLVGLTTWSGFYVSGLAPWCARLDADGTLGMAVRGARQGGTAGGDETDLCPARQAIVRFTINSGGVLDRLQATCAPIAGWLARRELGAALRSHGDSTGGSRHQDDCNAGYMAHGFELRTGDYLLIQRVLNLRLRCARVSDH
ncbi:MAG: hypothetical protein KA978_15030 [Deltaproteobacteria bacterium]|nr:hypothetical protein [Deltaproteobacteria bacterium]